MKRNICIFAVVSLLIVNVFAMRRPMTDAERRAAMIHRMEQPVEEIRGTPEEEREKFRRNAPGYAIADIESGDLAHFKRLVPAHVDPNSKSTAGYTLLQIAKFHKKQDIVDYLESLGAK